MILVLGLVGFTMLMLVLEWVRADLVALLVDGCGFQAPREARRTCSDRRLPEYKRARRPADESAPTRLQASARRCMPCRWYARVALYGRSWTAGRGME